MITPAGFNKKVIELIKLEENKLITKEVEKLRSNNKSIPVEDLDKLIEKEKEVLGLEFELKPVKELKGGKSTRFVLLFLP